MERRVDFSRVARAYSYLEFLVFGRALQRRRCAYLPDISESSRALILGDGDGRFAVEYASSNPQAELHLVDISPGMQAVAKRRLRRHGLLSERIRWTLADALTFEESEKYDLIVTHFFLDCFEEAALRNLVPRITRMMTGDGRWLVSEFELPPYRIQRFLAQTLIFVMYQFFGWFAGLKAKRLPRYASVLRTNGLLRVSSQSAAGGLLVSELWQNRPTSGR